MEPITKVMEEVKTRFEKIGLYMVDGNVATTDQEAVAASHGGGTEGGSAPTEDFRKKMADGESQWVLNCAFNIGKQAFTDRVLNPEKEAADTEFALIVPDEVDIMREKIRREGLAAFEPDEDEVPSPETA